jgi:hypothetical protein
VVWDDWAIDLTKLSAAVVEELCPYWSLAHCCRASCLLDEDMKGSTTTILGDLHAWWDDIDRRRSLAEAANWGCLAIEEKSWRLQSARYQEH